MIGNECAEIVLVLILDQGKHLHGLHCFLSKDSFLEALKANFLLQYLKTDVQKCWVTRKMIAILAESVQ